MVTIPFALKKCCAHSGCRELTSETRCPKHKKALNKERDQQRGNFRERYGNNWEAVRSAKLADYPCCEMCEKEGRTRAADVVHHIQRVHDRPDLVHEMDNLMSLCNPCHNKQHSKG